MASKVLTPANIYKNLTITPTNFKQLVSEEFFDGVNVEKYYIDGQNVQDGTVKILIEHYFCNSVKSKGATIFIIRDMLLTDEELCFALAKEGYFVVTADIAGYTDKSVLYTKYPESISYANYHQNKDKLFDIGEDIMSTQWYQWAVVGKYALNHARLEREGNKLCCIGLRTSGTSMWHTLFDEKNIDAVVFILNSGWISSKGHYKFSNISVTQIDDEKLSFISGVEAQSYASHILCPAMIIPTLCNPTYDVDRAYDTLAQLINSDKLINYCVSKIDGITYSSYQNMLQFIEGTLFDKNFIVPKEPIVDCNIVDKEIKVKVQVKKEDKIERLGVFYSENQVMPQLRCWQNIIVGANKTNIYDFTIHPVEEGLITLFVRVKYESGIMLSTPIIAKHFSKEEVNLSSRTNVIYSSRENTGKTIFFSADKDNRVVVTKDIFSGEVVEEVGPLDIKGVYSPVGLMTFAFNNKKFKPNEDSIIMFDIYSQNGGKVKFSLYTDYYGERKEYFYEQEIQGGEVWHNIKINYSNLKTVDLIPLKDINKVQVCEITCEGKYLLNNLIWA